MNQLVMKWHDWMDDGWTSVHKYEFTGKWYIDSKTKKLQVETKWDYGKLYLFKFLGLGYRSQAYIDEDVFVDVQLDSILDFRVIRVNGYVNDFVLTGRKFTRNRLMRYEVVSEGKNESWFLKDNISFLQDCN